MKTWQRRTMAVLAGFGLLVAIEGLCRLFGLGDHDPHHDPYASFVEERALFQLDPKSNTYRTAVERQKFFVEQSFPRKKAPESKRVFCLGGSTVQGRPYSVETSFTTWLRIQLEMRAPDVRWEIINAGGVSYASYRLVPILKECLAYEPDLLIVGTGHNEFLEERTYRNIKHLAPVLKVAGELNLFRLMQSVVPIAEEGNSGRPILKAEVDALLDYRGALAAYERDEEWRADVVEHFEMNLQRMVTMAQAQEVPLIFLDLPVNLKGSPPFKSLHREGLDAATLSHWEQLIAQADAAFASDTNGAIEALQAAIDIDPGYAHTHYSLGHCLLELGKHREAEQAFVRALEEDICPLRILPKMRARMYKVAEGRQVPVIDLRKRLAAECASVILGDEILVDHVHPAVRGHRLIAETLVEPVATALSLALERLDPAVIDRRCQEHLDRLPPLYFARGKQRLDNLRAWTQGRTNGPTYTPKS